MFQAFKHLDRAFQYVRGFTIVVVLCAFAFCCFVCYQCYRATQTAQARVYILANGKAIEAFATEAKQNVPVEARDHVKTFHQYFFSLDPDEKVISANVGRALYLADASAKHAYDNLKESGYYASLIAGNISQQVVVDSVAVSLDTYPYTFRCYATERMIRSSSIVTRSLVTEGRLRNVARSDNNPHGFLIEKWTTVENRDIKTEAR